MPRFRRMRSRRARLHTSLVRFLAVCAAAAVLAVGVQLTAVLRDEASASAAKRQAAGQSSDGASAGGKSGTAASAKAGGQATGAVTPTAGTGAASPSNASQANSGTSTLQPVPLAPWQDMPEDLQGTIGSFLSQQGAAGIAVGISTAQGRFLSLNGYSDLGAGTPLQATDRSAFRSITKSFVGTVILQLVAEGKLGLDDPVSRYVPAAPDDNAITVRLALEMRTGLVEYSDTQEFSDQMNSPGGYTWTDDQLLQDAFDQPLEFDPGTDFGYSNTNTVLLGQVIQAVTGQSWIQQVSSRLLAPLRLTSVVYPPDEPLGLALAGAYESTDAGAEAIGTASDTLYSAAGGLFGDIGDLLTWGKALGSGMLLPADLQAARLSPVSTTQNSDFTPAYDAYGLAMGELDGWWGHTGVGSGYESLVMYDPTSKTTIAILINTALADPNAAAELFRQLLPQLGSL
ncbi:MAG TPA: serine hydrolase [Micrococcaceae bacterium]|nr:serine hydrolase [Micrococcaceae bacterium]